ncbi:ABC-2 type transport system ATP-binding protein [Actinomadura pelletieri DSM 43383]|uniref:ABC-2 type transport system ATP-binding protein n=1 Tax=Actinomadura pelletieri DSM 43383 TaxID=1120940 RepID=A0A495QI09_9ACTN|nr:ATP-binding cassette domain-containing protein [Actinomadura pelletieri]RKS71644.1 ABC-2 type transport system ATP-binding protein [Actinomadura pelletieri DSM 43383]
MITLRGLTKRFGDKTAVDGVTVEVAAGKVTGFLGPNGAGKSTTMRMIVGLDRPTAGEALVGGRRYLGLPRPLREVGALLDAGFVHPGRSARAHLLAMARSNGIPRPRVDEVLGIVGLESVAGKRVGSFSLGMRQRLGIAGALLGDPAVLMFDEPVNGLDPDGVLWVRRLMRGLAAEGRTVFVSSHLMSEMQLTADRLVVLGRGRVLADASIRDVIARGSGDGVRVRSPRASELAARLAAVGAAVRRTTDEELQVTGLSVERVGLMAHEISVPVLELSAVTASLEEAYMNLTGASVEYGTATAEAQR